MAKQSVAPKHGSRAARPRRQKRFRDYVRKKRHR